MLLLEKNIVIVGGGFAGVEVAQTLEKWLSDEYQIIVISRENHLVFTPMLPEVAGRTISPLHVVVAGRQLTHRTLWLEAEVLALNHSTSEVRYQHKDGKEESLTFSHLVLCCGTGIDLQTIPGLATAACPLKTVSDAILLGNNLIGNFEAAAVARDPSRRQHLLTVAVIGGGFSGVEIAGHMNDLLKGMRRYYPEIKGEQPKIILLHGGQEVLPELKSSSLSKFTLDKLRESGIEVKLQTTVKGISDQSILLASGEQVEAGLIICTIGNAPHPLVKNLDLPLKKGRVETDSYMRVTGTNNLWAAGDCASVVNSFDHTVSPATAQFALQQARQLAHNIRRTINLQPCLPFRYQPRGRLAAIGHQNAVAEIGRFHISGFIAWLLWRAIYLFKLPTLSRKFQVAVEWFFSIFFAPNLVQIKLSSSSKKLSE